MATILTATVNVASGGSCTDPNDLLTDVSVDRQVCGEGLVCDQCPGETTFKCIKSGMASFLLTYTCNIRKTFNL